MKQNEKDSLSVSPNSDRPSTEICGSPAVPHSTSEEGKFQAEIAPVLSFGWLCSRSFSSVSFLRMLEHKLQILPFQIAIEEGTK